MCAACVVLPRGLELNALNDSKKMTEKRREETFRLLTECPQVYYGIGFADQREIDEFNILQATFLAMQRAYAELLAKLPDKKALRLALVDGNRDPHLPLETRLVVKGDGTSDRICGGISPLRLGEEQGLWLQRALCGNSSARNYTAAPQKLFEKSVGEAL